MEGDGALQPLVQIVEQAERDHIIRALELTKGTRRPAIEMLQVSSETFYPRLDDFGLRKKEG